MTTLHQQLNDLSSNWARVSGTLAAAGGVETAKAGVTVQLKNIDGKGFANVAIDRAK
jgi:hypothetical protein